MSDLSALIGRTKHAPQLRAVGKANRNTTAHGTLIFICRVGDLHSIAHLMATVTTYNNFDGAALRRSFIGRLNSAVRRARSQFSVMPAHGITS
jgi:hypothetical protein